MMDIVCISTTDWDEIWGSRQQIMSRLAINGHRILFVERQVSLEQILRSPAIIQRRKRTGSLHQKTRQFDENIWLFSPPLCIPGRYYSHVLNQAGQEIVARALKKTIASLGFQDEVLWIYPPHSAPLIPLIKPRLTVYHCIDRFTAGQNGRKRAIIEQQEELLLDSVDCIFVNSKGLINDLRKKKKRRLTYIPSAVDLELFQKTDSIHPDLKSIPRPRLGFSGTLDARLDSSLIEKIATSRPEWHFVPLGETRPGFKHSLRLHSIPNIHFMGKKSYQELPQWMNGFDVFIIPYVQNERTFYISPLKFYEYMAIGKPIVTVPLPELIEFEEYCHMASSPESFVAEIELALTSETGVESEKRRQAACNHSWERRADTMMSVIKGRLREIYA